MRKVLFGGAFDLLHAAHVRAIHEAKKYGDYLVVSVLSDARVRYKRSERRGFNPNLAPVIPEAERIEMVSALRDVDEVVCLSGVSDYPVFVLLEEVKPDVLVFSQGENSEQITELRDLCEAQGIEIVTLPRVVVPSGLDTTGIIEKIRS